MDVWLVNDFSVIGLIPAGLLTLAKPLDQQGVFCYFELMAHNIMNGTDSMFADMDARAIKATGKVCTFSALLYANTSTVTVITEKTLLKILWGEEPIGDWLPHVYSFFNECPRSILFGFSEENQIPLIQMKKIFYQIPVESWSPFLALCVKHGISEAMSREKADNIFNYPAHKWRGLHLAYKYRRICTD